VTQHTSLPHPQTTNLSFVTHSWLSCDSFETHSWLNIPACRISHWTPSSRSWLTRDSLVTHSWLIRDSFVLNIPACRISHWTSTSRSWLIYDWIVTHSWITCDSFVTQHTSLPHLPLKSPPSFVAHSWLIRDLLVTHAWLIRDSFFNDSFITHSWLTRDSLMTHSCLIHNSSVSHWWIFREATYELAASPPKPNPPIRDIFISHSWPTCDSYDSFVTHSLMTHSWLILDLKYVAHSWHNIPACRSPNWTPAPRSWQPAYGPVRMQQIWVGHDSTSITSQDFLAFYDPGKCMCEHIHIHTRRRTHTHTRTHTDIHTHTHTYTHTHTHTRTHEHVKSHELWCGV